MFYELEQCGVLTKERPPLRPGAKGQRRPDQPLSEAIKHLRDVGVVPWWWITDQTRHVFAYGYAQTVADYLIDRLDEARINPWSDDPPPLILWEARSMAGVLQGIAADHVCPITATNGQAGGFLHTEVVPQLIPGRAVLYLGDLDLRGDLIEQNTRRVLERETGHAIDWQRLAITAEQVAERGLEPIVKTDAVLKRTHEAYECEALGQRVVMSLRSPPAYPSRSPAYWNARTRSATSCARGWTPRAVALQRLHRAVRRLSRILLLLRAANPPSKLGPVSGKNTLYHGNKLGRAPSARQERVGDLVYLDPPFNSNATYNVLFQEHDDTPAPSQIEAFGDTWHWDQSAAEAYQHVVEQGGRDTARARLPHARRFGSTRVLRGRRPGAFQ